MLIFKYTCGAVSMVQWVTVPATKPDNLNWENQFLQVVLWPPWPLTSHACMHVSMHILIHHCMDVVKGQCVQKSPPSPRRSRGGGGWSQAVRLGSKCLSSLNHLGPTLAFICRCCKILPALLPLSANLGLVAGSAFSLGFTFPLSRGFFKGNESKRKFFLPLPMFARH